MCIFGFHYCLTRLTPHSPTTRLLTCLATRPPRALAREGHTVKLECRVPLSPSPQGPFVNLLSECHDLHNYCIHQPTHRVSKYPLSDDPFRRHTFGMTSVLRPLIHICNRCILPYFSTHTYTLIFAVGQVCR